MYKIIVFSALMATSASANERVTELRNFLLDHVVEYCQGYPSKEHCDDGDSTIFNGLLCASGEEIGCRAVQDAQDEDGRWWRSPRRKNGNLGSKNSFSRDQGYGVLLYLAATKDREAAVRWLKWIEDNRACSLKNPFNSKVCSVKGPHRLCRDDESMQCTITPSFWSLMGQVWDYLGLPKHGNMKAFAGSEKHEIELVAAQVAKLGYATHLNGVQVYIKRVLGYDVSHDPVLNIIIERQLHNPFFKFLKYGPDHKILDQLVSLCPGKNSDLSFRRFQWSWERDWNEKAWQESMGWDCIFMLNLLGG